MKHRCGFLEAFSSALSYYQIESVLSVSFERLAWSVEMSIELNMNSQ